MTKHVQIDFEKVKASVAALKANHPTEAEITADPKAFLAKHGVEISDDIHHKITAAMTAKKAGSVQAAIIHLDG